MQTAHHPKLTELEQKVQRFCSGLWREPAIGKLLLLYGENGAGKTHCARAVCRWVSSVGHAKQYVRTANHISHINCIYWHWPHLLDTLKNGGWDVIQDTFDATLLIIDELGGGHDPSGVGTDKLCQILSRREGMWTLITTNVLPAAWEQAFDRRIASRLVRSADHVDLSDVPDFNLR